MDVPGNKFQHQSSTPKTVELQYLRAITKQFSEDQILGKGGFGTVYKGEKENGEVVAVKKLINMVGMDDKHFLSEVKHLVDVCHPNIVRLEGYCYHIERVLMPYNGSLILADEVYRLLCFEYLPNGSLDKHLTVMVPAKWRRRLQTTSNYTSLEEDCRQVNQCIEVGLKCMEREPKKRPNIREIIEMLNGSENSPGGEVNQVNGPFYPTANYDPRPSTSIPDYLNTHDYQDQRTPPIDQQQISTLPDWQQNLGPMNSPDEANEDWECYLADIYFEASA